MKIQLLCVGKDKEDYVKTAVNTFRKRLTAFTDLELTYLPDTALSGTNNSQIVAQREGGTITGYLEKKSKRATKQRFIVCLDAGGKTFDSQGFALFLNEKLDGSDLIFIIGGVYGLSSDVKNRADLLLSLSKMTLTHQMTRIVLMEQLYRAFTIIKGKQYHY